MDADWLLKDWVNWARNCPGVIKYDIESAVVTLLINSGRELGVQASRETLAMVFDRLVREGQYLGIRSRLHAPWFALSALLDNALDGIADDVTEIKLVAEPLEFAPSKPGEEVIFLPIQFGWKRGK